MPVLQSIPGQYNPASQSYNAIPQGYVPQSQGGRTVINRTTVPTTSGSVLGASTGPSTPVGSSGQPSSINNAVNGVNGQLQSGLGQIDQGYNDYISQIDTQQGNVQRSAADATAGVDVNAQGARNQLGNQLNTANASYDTQSQQATKQGATATQQARDLYRQLQQQNVAQLSGSGLSSSSVAEALAENLGVETARRIAGVTGSTQEVLQNISKEKTNMGNYVNQQLSDLEAKVGAAKNSIQTQLLNSIDQLNNQRNVAASQKAQSRQQLIQDAQSQVASLQQQAQDFQQSLQQWQAQNSQKLQQTAVDFSKINQAANAVQGLAQANLPMSSAVTDYLQSVGVNVPSDYQPTYVGSINPNSQSKKAYDPTDPSTWQ